MICLRSVRRYRDGDQFPPLAWLEVSGYRSQPRRNSFQRRNGFRDGMRGTLISEVAKVPRRQRGLIISTSSSSVRSTDDLCRRRVEYVALLMTGVSRSSPVSRPTCWAYDAGALQRAQVKADFRRDASASAALLAGRSSQHPEP
ncbi:hypothetical protein KCP73_24560 [Salmonella enterica subsp. enterica]|nr:hypothetical protein KCP73_24560 [Salmonella enterica subsp. enterica]